MNRYRFLFLFFLVFNFVFYNSWAQPAKILDSIKQVLQRTTSDSVKYRGYADLSWYYADTRTKLDSTRMYADSIKFLYGGDRKSYAIFWFKHIHKDFE